MTDALIDTSADVPQWTLGDRLRKSLSDRGLKQADVEAALGKGKGTASGWVQDIHLPTYSELKDWAAFTRVPLWWLLDSPPGPHGDTALAYQAFKRTWREQAALRSRWGSHDDLDFAA